MIDYVSTNMPIIPNMYDINDLFANFTNNWWHLRHVFSLLFGIIFGFFLMRKIMEGMDEFVSIGEAAQRVSDRAAETAEKMKVRAGMQAEKAKERAADSLKRAKERSEAMMEQYADNYKRKMEIRHEIKFNFKDTLEQQKEEQRQAVVFLAALANKKNK